MPEIEPVTIKIDDVELSLVYDYNQIADAEAETGTNLLMALERLGGMNAKQLRGLLYAAIQPPGKLTVREVGKLIRLDTIGLLTAAMSEAYMRTLPKYKPKELPAKGLVPVKSKNRA